MRKRQVEAEGQDHTRLVASLVHPYRQALDQLRRDGRDRPLLERLSELVSLLDVATVLGSDLTGGQALDSTLQIVLREMGLERGALFVRDEGGELTLRASRDLPEGAPSTLGDPAPAEPTVLGPGDGAFDRHGLALLVPIRRRGRAMAVLGLGPREGGGSYEAEDLGFPRRVATCVAAAIESDLLHDELRRVHQKMSTNVFQLHNLFDINRELAEHLEEKAIYDLVTTSVMGHFLVSRCALYLFGTEGLSLVHQRGLPGESENAPVPADQARATVEGLVEAKAVAELPEGPLRRRLEKARLVLAVPLAAGPRVDGVLAIGERSSGVPFSAADREFALTLGLQTLAALENARLLRLRDEKLRQDRELQIAREIQHGLFPPRPPEVTGFEVAAESRSCREVGGDAYDWMDLGGGRLALVIADVSGKGTPASLLMASVHASVRALAGTAPPALVVERLNRFLFASTPANRFVTFFYAELDAPSRRLAYVNAGHVPPYRLARDGTMSRLTAGGPALGLLDEASYETGEVQLQAGDVVAMVTDGVTEAYSPDEREFGDDRVCEVLRARSLDGAPGVLAGLLTAVVEWEGPAGCSDDLTALVLKARERT
jgi:sigma-B regulation protein RsbU (phosphoserine phosphatase)